MLIVILTFNFMKLVLEQLDKLKAGLTTFAKLV